MPFSNFPVGKFSEGYMTSKLNRNKRSDTFANSEKQLSYKFTICITAAVNFHAGLSKHQNAMIKI